MTKEHDLKKFRGMDWLILSIYNIVLQVFEIICL